MPYDSYSYKSLTQLFQNAISLVCHCHLPNDRLIHGWVGLDWVGCLLACLCEFKHERLVSADKRSESSIQEVIDAFLVYLQSTTSEFEQLLVHHSIWELSLGVVISVTNLLGVLICATHDTFFISLFSMCASESERARE
jgi:hypothetical protein